MFTNLARSAAIVLLLMAVFGLAGCGTGGSQTSSSGVGAVAIDLVWSGAKSANKALKAPSTVSTVQIVISGPAMASIQQTFAASSGGGTIGNVPAGSGLTVTAYALDSSGNLLYKGTVGNVTVLAGQTTDVVTVIMLSVPTVASITVTPSNSTIGVGATQQFVATGTFSNMSTVDLTTITSWSSSTPSAATIAASGIATAVGVGATTITATSGAVAGTTGLTVTPANLVSIAILPANPTGAVGTTQQFTATGTFSDHTTQDLTSSVVWSSSATTVATISNAVGKNGLASPVAAGIATISAVSGSIVASTSYSVTEVTLVSLAISPANSSTPLGTPLQLSATGTYSDNSTQNLTSLVSWSSSLTSVAAISNATGQNGLVTPAAAGTTSISATMQVSLPIPGSISAATSLTVTGGANSLVNVLPITVNGSLCSSVTSKDYYNKPCVSVTVCNPNGSGCQVINDVLLDTGSYGLRIFQPATPFSLTPVLVGSSELYECVQYADGSANWGPVQTAMVILGGEPAVQVPIQVIQAASQTTGSHGHSVCTGATATPSDAGFTAILGVGLLTQDCGPLCVTSSGVGLYYTCSGSTCSGAAVPLASQVTNPVALLPTDNNGVLVQLPAVPLGGVSSVNNGSLILGIGTRANNATGTAKAYPADSDAYFNTTFSGQSSAYSFIDSGSNGLYFTVSNSQLPDVSDFYDPAVAVGSALSFAATTSGDLGTPTGTVSFQVGNYDSLVNTGRMVFSEMAGDNGTGTFAETGFDWGLPFFFGRSVFVGFDGTSSNLGTGPYWAY